MQTRTDLVRKFSLALAARQGEVLGVAGLVTGLAATVSLGLGAPLLLIGLVLYGLAIHGRRLRSSIRSTQLDRTQVDLERAADLSEFMSALATDLGLRAPWRISVYEEAGGSWVRVARASNHAPLRRSGRMRLPMDQGVLSAASRTGVVESFTELPNPSDDWDEYLRFQNSRQIPSAVASGFMMKSRSYASVVKPVRALSGDMVDVGLVCESEHPSGVRAELVDRHVGPHVMQLLHRLLQLGPSLREAREHLDDRRTEQTAEEG